MSREKSGHLHCIQADNASAPASEQCPPAPPVSQAPAKEISFKDLAAMTEQEFQVHLARKRFEAAVAPLTDGRPYSLELAEIEIRRIQTDAAISFIEIGKRLLWVKAHLQHGEFGPWLEQHCDITWNFANRCMAVARRLVGKPHLEPVSKLGVRKAYELLAEMDEVAEAELEQEATVFGRTLDEYDRMTARETRAILRQHKEKGAAALEKTKGELDDVTKAFLTAESENDGLRKQLADLRYSQRGLDEDATLAHLAKLEREAFKALKVPAVFLRGLTYEALTPKIRIAIRGFWDQAIETIWAERLNYYDDEWTLGACVSKAELAREQPPISQSMENIESVLHGATSNLSAPEILELINEHDDVPQSLVRIEASLEILRRVHRVDEVPDPVTGEIRYRLSRLVVPERVVQLTAVMPEPAEGD